MAEQMKKIALAGCSDARKETDRRAVRELCRELEAMALTVRTSRYLFEADAKGYAVAEKAAALMELYRDQEVRAIFDISGGDLANELLDHLDYEQIAQSDAVFAGYSDLTCLLNAIYHRTGKESWLYQIRNLVSADGVQQRQDFGASFPTGNGSLFHFSYRFVQGEEIDGVMIGGNIRCFLKLAGTGYMPDFEDKILFLEAFGGGVSRIRAMFAWLRQLGAFDRVNGIVLGTFTELERSGQISAAELLLQALEGRKLPVAVTAEIGHGSDAKCLRIGTRYHLVKEDWR